MAKIIASIGGAWVTVLDITSEFAKYVKKTGDTLTGFLTLHADPTAALHAVTKQYVDNKDKYSARAWRQAAVTSGLAATTMKIVYDIEVYDQANSYAAGNYVCPVAGRYLVRASASASLNANVLMLVYIQKNSSYVSRNSASAGSVGQDLVGLSVCTVLCAAGDTLSAWVYFTAASVPLRCIEYETFICVDYLGP